MITIMKKKIFKAVVYAYFDRINKKFYVGCTMEENIRRMQWKNLSVSYGGRKIDQIRRELGPQAFDYIVLERIEDTDKKRLKKKIETREAYYIEYYDSCKNGYNSNYGGRGNKGVHLSQDHKKKIADAHKKPIIMHNVKKKVDEFFESLTEVSKKLGIYIRKIHKMLSNPQMEVNGYCAVALA